MNERDTATIAVESEAAFYTYEASRKILAEAQRRWKIQSAYLLGITNPTVPANDIRRARAKLAEFAEALDAARAQNDADFNRWQELGAEYRAAFA